MLPEYRRQGCAQALLRALAAIAVERGCGRFEWAVLDWNAPAIEFYRALGATVLPDWRIVRVVGRSLEALAGHASRVSDDPLSADSTCGGIQPTFRVRDPCAGGARKR